nr:MAG TPA: hypothetical protein [Caudoviricetes sp.]
MITLTQVNQYVKINNIDDNTNIFSILSQMQLEYKENPSKRVAKSVSPTPSATKVEYSTQDVLDLFST